MCKLPFDIEIKPNQFPFPPYIMEGIQHDIFETVSTALADEFGIQIEFNDMVILSSSTDTKSSEHYVFNKVHFSNWDKACDFVKTWIIPELKQNLG